MTSNSPSYPFLSVRFGGFKDIYSVMQPSPPAIQSFLIFPSFNSVPIEPQLPSPQPQATATYFCRCESDSSGNPM